MTTEMDITVEGIRAAGKAIQPQPGPQTEFLRSAADVVFYGGQAGGGKTYGLLLEPLYDASNGRFGAVIFRRTTKQVRAEGGLWDTAQELYVPLGAAPNQQDLSCTFASGAKITFAHMEHEKNRYDWAGSQIPLIEFDELTHFTWRQFNYLLSRNRSTSGAKARIRATLNPDPDHWVRQFIDWWIDEDGYAIKDRGGVIRHFIIQEEDVIWADSAEDLQTDYPGCMPKSFTFIPASVQDNKILLQSDPNYLANLDALTRVERARLRDGNWKIRATAGMYFHRSDFEIVDIMPRPLRSVRAWDLAGTKADPDNDSGPAWTAGVRMHLCVDGCFYVDHVERFRADPGKVDARIENTAKQDGNGVTVRLPQDPGQAGKRQARSQVAMLAGFTARALPVTGDKETRAKPLSAQTEAGNVKLVRGSWNEAFLSEMENFPDGRFKDQVDAAADAFDELASSRRRPAAVPAPGGARKTSIRSIHGR